MRHATVRDIPQVVPCKVCGAPAKQFGTVDSNRSCNTSLQESPSFVLIPYHRCGECGLLFTVAFDKFSKDDFAREIYNEGYAAIDPDFFNVRPASNAQILIDNATDSRRARILDYGGGIGAFARELRAAGFENVTTYDPFVPEFSQRPGGTFDLVTCFEVVEHTPTPRETFADINSFVAGDGSIFFSTVVQPPDFDQVKMKWWYIGPRNGHVTIYSTDSLNRLAIANNFNFASTGEVLHLMYRRLPDFARKWLAGSAEKRIN